MPNFASAGSFVGAALETTGFYYQELFLDVFTTPFVEAVAPLFFIVAALVAVVSVVMQGNYRFALWLFLGPGIFLSVIFPRTETFGSTWIFGNEARENIEVQEHVTYLLSERDIGGPILNDPANVSSVFNWYTSFVSSQVREIVSTLNTGRYESDRIFIRRGEMFASLQQARSEDSDFRDLLHTGFLGRCRDVVYYGRQLSRTLTLTNRPELAEQFQAAQQSLQNLSGGAVRYVATIKAAYPGFYDSVIGVNHDAVDGFIRDVTRQNPGSAPAISGSFQASLPADLAEVRQQVFSCEQVWMLIRLGLVLQAKDIVALRTTDAEQNGLDPARAIFEIGRLVGVDSNVDVQNIQSLLDAGLNLDRLYRVVASYILRNELDSGLPSDFASDFAERFELREIADPHYEDMIDFQRRRLEGTESREQSSMMNAAAQLPYYQGLVLYFLGALFPFFTLLLLIPGQHTGFLYWFILYLWAKSWDIGFAVVMMADEILFSIFQSTDETNAENGEAILSPDVSETFLALSELDPTFSLSTYYTIIGSALMAIPVVTAQIVLGGMKAGSGLIAQGIKEFSGNTSSGSYHANAGASTQANAAQVQTNAYNQANARVAAAASSSGSARYAPQRQANRATSDSYRSSAGNVAGFSANGVNQLVLSSNASQQGRVGVLDAQMTGDQMQETGSNLTFGSALVENASMAMRDGARTTPLRFALDRNGFAGNLANNVGGAGRDTARQILQFRSDHTDVAALEGAQYAITGLTTGRLTGDNQLFYDASLEIPQTADADLHRIISNYGNSQIERSLSFGISTAERALTAVERGRRETRYTDAGAFDLGQAIQQQLTDAVQGAVVARSFSEGGLLGISDDDSSDPDGTE